MKGFKLIAFAGFIMLTTLASAQQVKIAYVNSQDLLEAMPEAKVAQTQLAAMAGQLDSIYKKYINEYQMLIQKIQNPLITEIEKDAIGQDLSYLEQRIQQYEQDSQSKLDAKKAELFQPIIDKATAVVKEVAKEAGYAYVIDNSLGVLIMAPDGDNILPLVKKKMNIQ
jgi:outer membrane protein